MASEDQITNIDPNWQGEFNLDDCKEENFTPDLNDIDRRIWAGVGVRLIHMPTGLSVRAYGSQDIAENRKRAERALKKRVMARP